MSRLSKPSRTLFPDKWTCFVVLILVGLISGVGSGFSPSYSMDCSQVAFEALQLRDEEFQRPVIISSAVISTKIGTTTVPEHCAVQGTVWPAIRFSVKLPTTKWNQRYYQVGNGGLAGSIQEASMVPGLQQRYATAGNDLGHSSAEGPTWTVTSATNPHAEQKIIDFAYRADHETNVLARKLVKVYYGHDPLYAYYVGCSRGGQEGLTAAQRYPKDYDGLVIGAPIQITAQNIGHTWNAQVLMGDGRVELDPLGKILADKVFAKCDGIDGLVDGFIDDPLKCAFDPSRDLPLCPGPVPCFTPAQINALNKVYGGPKNSAGDKLFHGQVFGAEMFAPKSQWEGIIILPPGSEARSAQYLRQLGFYPPEINFDWRSFNFDTDPPRLINRSSLIDPVNPNLSQLSDRGGKIIHYHGWADVTCNPLMSTSYYQSVMELMGRETSKAFYKLYMVPGMGHCGGGTGCYDRSDGLFWVLPLVNWVENGIEPGALVGTRVATPPNTPPYLNARTRPLCPYPEVARYSGTGSIDDATNFMCVPPIQVRIEPESLDLKSKGEFTASITLSEGYDVRDWNIQDVSCEGAPALKGMTAGNSYVAKFNKEDLKNVSPGERVALTVKLAFHHGGKKALTQGSDTVRVQGPPLP
jgi:pimeloyl-ACP methyl ester carboxylesterase